MQDKLITGVHNKARQRYEELLRATEEARTRAVEVLEDVGSLVLDDTVSDETLRQAIFATISSDDLNRLVVGCRALRDDSAGSPLGLVAQWYGYTRQYSPVLLERTPLQFAQQSPTPSSDHLCEPAQSSPCLASHSTLHLTINQILIVCPGI